MEKWTTEDLLDQIITKANQVSIINESYDLREMRKELLLRFEKLESERDEAKLRVETLKNGFNLNE